MIWWGGVRRKGTQPGGLITLVDRGGIAKT